MAELVVGTGKQNCIRSLLKIFETQIKKVSGQPRKIIGRATGMEVEADRNEFEGGFESYQIKVELDEMGLATVKEVVSEFSEVLKYAEEDGKHVLTCQNSVEGNGEHVIEAIDMLSTCIMIPEVWRIKGDHFRIEHVSSELLFQALIQYKASDVHLAPGESPVFRIDTEVHHSEIMKPVSAEQILTLIRELAPDDGWQEFVDTKQTSFSFHQVGLGYARVSAFSKSGAPHITLRFLPEEIPSFADLQIPTDTMEELAKLHRGLLLVTGMTGSGKTTTCAALVDWINSHKPLHILTIENPVEYVHRNKKSFISQRNLGLDVLSFDMAVTGALRHDPDVIVIGEMRDADTIRSAINAAATGHLVISTLHANTASEVINRIISFFDPVERDLVKLQLRDCIQCIICQRLAPKVGGGRVPALEILFNDIKPITDGIIEGNTDAMRIGMQQKVGHSFLFEEYLYKLFKEGKIDVEHGQEYSTDQSIFDQMRMGTYSIPRLEALKAARDASQRS